MKCQTLLCSQWSRDPHIASNYNIANSNINWLHHFNASTVSWFVTFLYPLITALAFNELQLSFNLEILSKNSTKDYSLLHLLPFSYHLLVAMAWHPFVLTSAKWTTMVIWIPGNRLNIYMSRWFCFRPAYNRCYQALLFQCYHWQFLRYENRHHFSELCIWGMIRGNGIMIINIKHM